MAVSTPSKPKTSTSKKVGTNPKTMTQRQYAKYVGVPWELVIDWLEAGIITTLPNGRIDPEKADAEREGGLRSLPKENVDRDAEVDPEKTDLDDAPKFTLEDLDQANYGHYRTLTERYKAFNAKLQYEIALGNLLDKEKVMSQVFSNLRRVRDRVLQVSDREAGHLSMLSDPRDVRNHLHEQLQRALEVIADDFEALGLEESSEEYGEES